MRVVEVYIVLAFMCASSVCALLRSCRLRATRSPWDVKQHSRRAVLAAPFWVAQRQADSYGIARAGLNGEPQRESRDANSAAGSDARRSVRTSHRPGAQDARTREERASNLNNI